MVFFALLLASCSAVGEVEAGGPHEGTVAEVTVENGRVAGLDLETEDGVVDISIDTERDYGFDLFHLREHRASGDPVVIETAEVDGELVALSIEDV